jgi:hypothetical protein
MLGGLPNVLLTGLSLLIATAAAAGDLLLVPEMQRPPGIAYEPAARRAALADLPEAAEGLRRLRIEAARRWPEIVRLDLGSLSRRDAELTRRWAAPAEPGPLEGRPIGRGPDGGPISLELRGPRLPSRHDIVERYLYLYATYDPGAGTLGPLVVTIRGRVLE